MAPLKLCPIQVPARRNGFTILEVVLAVGILFVGITAVLGFLSVGAALARTASLRGASAQAVEAVVADLEENAFPLLSSEGGQTFGRTGVPQDLADRPVPGHPGLVYSAAFTRDPDAPGDGEGVSEYRVDIVISWSVSGERRSKSFTTLLLGEIPFGERMRRTFVERDLGEVRPQIENQR